MSPKTFFDRVTVRIPAVIMAFLVLVGAAGCSTAKTIPQQSGSVTGSLDSSNFTQPSASLPEGVGEEAVSSDSLDASLYGSYLTMFTGTDSEPEYPYAVRLTSYYEVEKYYYENERQFFFGARFTTAMASFSDEFLRDSEVLILAVSDPSAYTSFVFSGIEIKDGRTVFTIERHTPENAPERQSIAYHLVFTAPKGGFELIDTENIELELVTVIDPVIEDVNDAERFRYVYPEFWPFSYQAPALSDDPMPVVASVNSYNELLGFYESYKEEFDLDLEFFSSIGPLYSENLFRDYVVLIAILPYDTRSSPPVVSELFVYNLSIWMTLDSYTDEIPKSSTGWVLLSAAVQKNQLEGVNLKEIYIGG